MKQLLLLITSILMAISCASESPRLPATAKNFNLRFVSNGSTSDIWADTIMTLHPLDSFRENLSSLKALRTNINKLPYWLAKDIRNNKIKLHVIYKSSLIAEQALLEVIQTETAVGKVVIDLIPEDRLVSSFEIYYTHLKELSAIQQATNDLLPSIVSCTSDKGVQLWYEQLPTKIKERLEIGKYRLYLTDTYDYAKKEGRIKGISYQLAFHVASFIGNRYLDFPKVEIVSFTNDSTEKVNSEQYSMAVQLIIAPAPDKSYYYKLK